MTQYMSWRERMRGRNAAPVVDHPALTWWREARFGMFIHWGLYAIPAGIWKGEQVEGIGEWIMFRKRIPRAEYEPLAKQFDPTRFRRPCLGAARGRRRHALPGDHLQAP